MTVPIEGQVWPSAGGGQGPTGPTGPAGLTGPAGPPGSGGSGTTEIIVQTSQPTSGSTALLWIDSDDTSSSSSGVPGSLPTGGTLGQSLVKNSSTDYDSGWTTLSGLSTLQGQIELDAMAGATDDDKLTNAMTLAAGQAYPPPILLGPKNYSFSTNRTLYDGFTLIGVQGMGNAELTNQGTNRTRVTVGGTGTWLSANGGVRSASQNWDIAIRNISFTGNSSKQFIGGTAVLWCMNLHDCSWSSWSSILGSQATKLLINLCLFDGWLSFHNSYHGGIHIGGSDNALFLGMTNIDSGTAFNSSGGANGQYHLWLDSLEKSTIGPIYLTCEGAWNGIRVSGPAHNTGGSNLGGPLWITGAKIEGRNAGAACNGSAIRVEGGQLHLRDTWIGYGMVSPATPGHSPQDAGMIHQTAGQLLVDGCTYDRATGVAETVPFVYSAGGKARVSNTFIGSKGGTWSGLPRVTGSGVTADNSVTVI